jgi:hypothetical protein
MTQQTIHPKHQKHRPKVIQISATEWEGEPRIIALFDDGQLMVGYFTHTGAFEWNDLQKPCPA